MLLKKKKVKAMLDNAGFVAEHNEDTSARVRAVLAQLSNKNYVVIAKVQSDSNPKVKYEIRMGTNNAVYCECKGWQFSKTGTCKHIERFRTNCKPQVL